MKRAWPVLLGFVLLVAPIAQAQLTYTTNADGMTATITGYSGSGGLVAIPAATNGLQVTSICPKAFYGCYSLTGVTIPASVTNIGEQAFDECFSLSGITLLAPSSFYSTPGGVLFDASQSTLIQYPVGRVGNWVQDYTIPAGVTNIGNRAFDGCAGLTSLTIPVSVASVGEGAFNGCIGLTNVTIPGSVTTIGAGAFDACTCLTAIMVDATNASYCSVGGVLFDISQSALIQFPGGLGGNFTIPATVTSIGVDAFQGCASLTNVSIPASVTNIGAGAFDDCVSLSAITVDPTNSFYCSVNGVLFDINQSTLIQYPGGLGGNCSIPGTVTSIGDYAFDDCAGLTGVTIPAGVTNIGNYAFYGCGALTNAMLPNGLSSIGDHAFFLCSSLPSVTIPAGVANIAEDAFAYCSKLTNALIANGVSNIGQDAFDNCSSLISVAIPGSVTNIGNYAFYDCGGLAGATIANGVSSIGNEAFFLCNSLAGVTIPGSVTSIGVEAFAFCSKLTAITVDATNSFYGSVNGVLFDASQSTLIQFPGGLGGNYAIPASVTTIGDYAFYGCTGLTSVTIPASVTNIGNYQFYDCGGLTNATIGNGVSSLGNYAFFFCRHLVSVAIGGGLTNIGGALMYCDRLTNVFFQANPPTGSVAAFLTDNGRMNETVYYLPGTSGWGSTFDGLPAVLWNPLIQAGGSSFGVRTNHFGFNITGTANIPIVVEACTNLASPVWTPLKSLRLTNGSVYFSEPFQTNSSIRYYRIGSQ